MTTQFLPVVSQLLVFEGKSLTEISKALLKKESQLLRELSQINAAYQEKLLFVARGQGIEARKTMVYTIILNLAIDFLLLK